MNGVIQCGYCRLEHLTIKRVGYVCCSRCHSVIPIQTCEVTNCTNILKNRTQKDVQLQKTRSSSLNHYTYRNGNLGSTSGSAEYKAMASQRPKASFTILNACPRSIPAARVGKRALICGVSYKKQKYKLRGTLTDVYNIKQLLLNRYHFPEHEIRVLTEENTPDRLPTKANMEESLRWLVAGSKPGDSLVFYFSGHGLRQHDFDNDELDGFDETLCPVDFKTEGMILDNDINTMIVKPLIKGVTLHAIIDACHSGTILDLEYLYDLKGRKWLNNIPPSGAKKCTRGGRAICFSACRDDEMATDSNAFTKKGMSGVMTHCFIQAILSKPKLTYFELLNSVRETILETFASRCISSKLIDKLLYRKLSQAGAAAIFF
ncbi:metacaspase-1 isoform X2 [Spinacia oleracea]|uniref:Metacaspase-1 isoform X2 n=1 Tax=Spinacia oleracea TaxID=3562 RepID=A0A9R0JKU5_SPIOL|nr:metacaspase-1-like isoform X2 [Spinacia oleracea]XP_056698909.1 metacaspase-1-like isoform X2 [Spinacia oleracea]